VRTSRHDAHTLSGAYAADALPPGETVAFERHLRHCPACAEEVRGLRETAAGLAMATAIAPPPAMRARVLAAAARTRQEAPLARRTAGASVRPARRLPRMMAKRPTLLAAAVSLAAAVIALGVFSGVTQHQLQQANSRNQAVAAVLAAPDARLATASTSVGGTVTAVVALREHQVVITAHGMPSLTGARVYQLWVMTPGTARPAGLLAAGSAAPVLVGGVRSGDRIGMTVEPAGGTRQPTTTPIMVMPVQA
jgi:hypothetical protein